jgi:glucokinase
MYIGIDIGGTKILVVRSSDGKHIDAQEKLPTPSDGHEGVETIIQLVNAVAGEHPFKSIGVVAPNMHVESGTIMEAVNMPGWHGAPIKQRLEEHFDVPVAVENDANGGALAEAHLGAGQGYKTMLYVTWSTGIGTGLVLDGKAYHGAFDTEGGHMVIDPEGPICGCGVAGHWEAVIAGPAIKKKYGKEAWQLKDAKSWDEISYWMAIGLANLIHVYSPEIIVLGGGVSTHSDHFMKPLHDHLAKLLTIYPAPQIVIARHIEEAAAYGALVLAKQAKK